MFCFYQQHFVRTRTCLFRVNSNTRTKVPLRRNKSTQSLNFAKWSVNDFLRKSPAYHSLFIHLLYAKVRSVRWLMFSIDAEVEVDPILITFTAKINNIWGKASVALFTSRSITSDIVLRLYGKREATRWVYAARIKRELIYSALRNFVKGTKIETYAVIEYLHSKRSYCLDKQINPTCRIVIVSLTVCHKIAF